MTTEFLSAHITETTLLQPAIQAWMVYLKDQGRSTHTLKAFGADLQLLADFLPPDKQLGQINLSDLEAFLKWLEVDRKVPCSPKTLSRRIISLKSFFRWLTKNAVISSNPSEKIPQKTVFSPLPTVLTAKECDLVLDAADAMRTSAKADPRPYVLLLLILETALKKGECLKLMLNHLELENTEEPYVFVRYSSPRYRYKERKVRVSPDWVAAFKEYAEMYQIKDQVFPWSQRRLEYLLEDVGNAAGLEKHLSFDMCRWTSALLDLTAGMETDKIRQKLGVSKIQWREISNKLRNLAKEYGYPLPESTESQPES